MSPLSHIFDESDTKIRFIFLVHLLYLVAVTEIIQDSTAVTHNRLIVHKAMSELLINDYTRKGLLMVTVFTLPTICIRPGKPNKATSSFVK